MHILKVDGVDDKYVPVFLARNNVPFNRLQLLNRNGYKQIIGDHAHEISKFYLGGQLIYFYKGNTFNNDEQYCDVILFNWNRVTKSFGNKESTSDWISPNKKVPLFVRRKTPSQNVFYSYVDWSKVKIKPVVLTVSNFSSWMSFYAFDPEDFETWMDETKILLRFYRKNEKVHDKSRSSLATRYKYNRRNIPGDYEPSWTPRFTLFLMIPSFPFDKMEVTSIRPPEEIPCGMPNCRYTAPRAERIEIHRKTCRDYTLVTGKQVKYGAQVDSYKPILKFACFDIETVEKQSDNGVEATLEILSIGVASNINQYQSKYFVRDSSVPASGQKMVDDFMDYCFQLNQSYQELLPPGIAQEYAELELQLKNSFGKKTENQDAFVRRCQLKEQLIFSLYGFNSQKFDMKVLVGYIVVYATERKMEISLLKKGSSYFQLEVGTLAFKGKFITFIYQLTDQFTHQYIHQDIHQCIHECTRQYIHQYIH